MAGLMAENPYYDRYHLDMRWMILKHAPDDAVSIDDGNALEEDIFDKTVTDDDFLTIVDRERRGNTVQWNVYRRWIIRLRDDFKK